MKLLYVCEWNKDKEKQWSGTTYSLYKALKTHIEVEDVDISLNIVEATILSAINLRIVKGKLQVNKSFRKTTVLYKQFKLNRLLSKNIDLPKLMIGDSGKAENAYYYIDLSVGLLHDIRKENSEASRYMNFSNIPISSLEYREKVQNNIFQNAKGVFTMGKHLANYIIKQNVIDKDKVKAVGGGINLDINSISPAKKSNSKILFVGRDFDRKGGNEVIEAFRILKQKHLKNAELFIAGANLDANIIKDNGIHLLGDLEQNQLSQYFNQCDIFCMPSIFEAYGLVFIEALSYGLPCIGRNSYEMKEFINHGENGYLIDDNDPEELALLMFDLLNNEKIKKNVRDSQEEYIKKYSWDEVAKRIINHIEITQS